MIWVGTAGYHYADWRGVFYPPGLPDRELLAFYAGEFPFTEVNATFYRPPTAAGMRQMAAKVPPWFRFFIKAYQGLTHKRDEAAAAAGPFVAAVGALGDQLAGVLLQFPNSFRRKEENRAYLAWLRAALGAIPAVVEFRHREWVEDEATFQLLRELDLAYACVDEPQFRGLVPPLVKDTAAPGYVRFHGRNYQKWWRPEHRDERYDYLYSEAELAEWVPRILDLERRTGLVYVSMNNHRRGQAVINGRMLRDLLQAAGAPVMGAQPAAPATTVAPPAWPDQHRW